ncbi:MAG: acyltransferase domain-containing protein [Lapillicoccus sp.]
MTDAVTTPVGRDGPEGLEAALRLFAVPEVDLVPLRAAQAALRREPTLSAWVTTTGDLLRAAMDSPSPGPVIPARPDGEPDVVAYLPVLVYADVLPDLLADHALRDVPPDVTAATLADVGRMLQRNRRWFGEAGVGDELAGWLTRHLRGALFQVGRLQYERVRLGEGAGLELQMAGFPCQPGDLTLNLHIPADGGSLRPEVVDASLAAAKSFFRKRFPDERYALVTCHSWLLDPQLLEVLPAGANLAAFQRRFTVGGSSDHDGDASVRKFVFGDLDTPLAALPQDTSLRRAVVGLLRRGGHWHDHSGWLAWR